ncbi:MAG TPA: glutamine--fructose-6-phosphate transaminase (isomerizing) [Bryobacteraceae bacterium]|nr:glutamine--fructose-6-phosphate transaminase (isomerizing) [Bryobacterales bacterium]HRJ17840.1 glutamine--fructose-6-phosphate transaminase (isomerizing) [Bryobacteraceae bacterium]
MSGIIGYVGGRRPVPILLEGLRRLEYRGYDSAGVAVVDGEGRLTVRRAPGKLHNLEEAVRLNPIEGGYGLGHTRWATHGRPTEQNAHPHQDSGGRVAVVHNGIVENYLELRERLEKAGRPFVTDTDTEVIPQLIEEHYRGSLEDAVRAAARELQGVYAFAAISSREPGKIVAVRQGPPVVIGLGEGENFVASDVPAILNHTRDMCFLDDGDVAVLTEEEVYLTDLDGRAVKRQMARVLWDPIMAEKGGYRHFTLKEIYEQPRAVRDTLVGRVGQESGLVFLDELDIRRGEFEKFTSVRLVACGTSWHAALAGKFMIEKLARVPAHVDYSSEFRYRDPILGPETLTVLVSQSGETADTLAALRKSRQLGSPTLAICNAMGSMLSREASGTLLTHAGPEIGVASTKTFTTQLTALLVFALFLAQVRGRVTGDESQQWTQELLRIPEMLEAVLADDREYAALADRYHRATDFLFLGRGIHYPMALEGALKMKELSYIHAEGYPAGEMKHGPNALINEDLPTVVVAAHDPRDEGSRLRYGKTLSSIREVQARGGRVIALATEGSVEVEVTADQTIWLPPAPELLLPVLEVVPLQLLAYHVAVRRGCDVDQPRNLAKSVTVE